MAKIPVGKTVEYAYGFAVMTAFSSGASAFAYRALVPPAEGIAAEFV
nr:hypothetical protein Hi04_10k_c4983_00015 [uncultured bacterium]